MNAKTAGREMAYLGVATALFGSALGLAQLFVDSYLHPDFASISTVNPNELTGEALEKFNETAQKIQESSYNSNFFLNGDITAWVGTLATAAGVRYVSTR